MIDCIAEKGAFRSLLLAAICMVMGIDSLSAQSYTDAASSLGIDHFYGDGPNAGGVSFVDFDQDGLDDLSIAGDAGDASSFYHNTGNGFQKITLPGVNDRNQAAKHILWLDYDNDGDLDLYITYFYAVNKLYENQGDLSFVDITEAAGLSTEALPSLGASWVDYDRDGFLDLYILDRRVDEPNQDASNRLYRNLGNGAFTEMTLSAQVADSAKYPFCSTFFDFDMDGWQDVFIAQDLNPYNTLLRNNGDGSFSDWSVRTGAHLPEVAGMGIAVGDCDLNGLLDLYVTNTPKGGSKLLLNNGHGFDEEAQRYGVGFHGFGWSNQFLDYDNDLDMDLYVSGAYVGAEEISSVFYANDNAGAFYTPEDIGFVGDTVESYSNALGDFNNDGYPDIAVVNRHAPTQLWHNSGGDLHWLKISLEGSLSNRDGIGSLIEVWMDGVKYLRPTHCGIGFMGQNSQHQLIGMGTHESADSVCINWPSGHRDVLYSIDANQSLHIVEGSTRNWQPVLQVEGPALVCEGKSLFLSAGIYGKGLQYQWSTGETSPRIAVQESGNYSLTITGAGIDYSGSIEINVENTQTPILDIRSRDLSCFRSNDGELSTTVTGGVGPYYYEWSNGHNGPALSQLAGGEYHLLLADKAGCEIDTTVWITEPDRLSIDIISTASGYAAPQGTAQAIVSGGTLPYYYQWLGTDNPANDGDRVEGLAPGRYQLLVTDANDCQAFAETRIEVITSLVSESQSALNLWPNPAASGRHIQLSGLPAAHYLWEIIDLQGRALSSGSFRGSGKHTIVLPHINPGQYVLQLNSEEGTLRFPLLLRD